MPAPFHIDEFVIPPAGVVNRARWFQIVTLGFTGFPAIPPATLGHLFTPPTRQKLFTPPTRQKLFTPPGRPA